MPAPPNLIKAILSGFDSTANHIALILFPVALDVFLWLGPHLRVKGLMENAILKITSLPGLATPETADMLKLSREYWLAAALRVNLFSALRSFPVGIPSLMVSRQPVLTPYGSPPFWEVSSLGVAALIWISLTIVGMVLGSLFFMLVGQVTQGEHLVDWRQTSLCLATGISAGDPADAFLAGGAGSHQHPRQLCAYPGNLCWARG